jgi:hypothetical protein
MDRRAFLAVLAAISGCSALDDTPGGDGGVDTQSPSPTGSPSGTATPQSSEKPTRTPTDSPTETAGETPGQRGTPSDSETEEPTATATEEPTPQGDEVTADFIQAALADLDEAQSAYGSYGDGSMMSVTAATTSFEWAAVVEHVGNAENHLDRAIDQRPNTRQRRRIKSLRDVAEYLRLTAHTQDRQLDCFAVVPRARAELYAERFGVADERREDLVSARETAADKLEEVRTQTEASNTDATDSLSRETYAAKLAQFDDELDSFAAFDAPFKQLIEGMTAFETGVQNFVDERWTPARTAFGDAVAATDDAAANLPAEIVPAEFASVVKEFRGVAVTVRAASEHLEASASAFRTSDNATGRARLDDAQDELRRDAVVTDELESAQQVLNVDT